MKTVRFSLERLQSKWEHKVRYNLSESGISPLLVEDLLAGEAEHLLKIRLGYNPTNGSDDLRAAIARLYRGAGPDNVLVTSGTAEANFLVTWHTLNPGDEVIFMVPNYMQVSGIAASLGVRVKHLPLREELDWRPDMSVLQRALSTKTRLIAVCNPNNPTGAVMKRSDMEAVIEAADKVGAWVLSDEIYRGAEIGGDETLSFWSRHPKVIVTAGLSKAFSLPGLRIGWVLAPQEVIHECWAIKDYLTIAPGTINDYLATLALAPNMLARIRQRGRAILQENLALVTNFIKENDDLFHAVPPRAGAIVFLRYKPKVNSTRLAEKLLARNVLIVPGDCFEMEGFVRIGIGGDKEELKEGLSLLAATLRGWS